MTKKKKIHWDEIDGQITRLQRKLEPSLFNFKNIYGIPRGGLVVAVMLSHKIDLPVITDKRQITRKTIVVDDIADTGDTLKKLLKIKKPGAIATLYFHPQSLVVPLYYVELKADQWLVFPWETNRSSKYDGTLK